MYCIKVPVGQERKELIKYSGAFLPSYISVDSDSTSIYGSRGIRRFIVPGYIFSIHKEGKAVTVPEKEWQIIEALSDPEPSYIDDQGKIVSGPLAEYNHLVTDIRDDSIRIQAALLEQDRIYWIRVRKAAEEPVPPKAEEPAPQAPDTEEKPAPAAQEAGVKKKVNPQDQKEQILADAEKFGIHAAAKSAGIPWQTVLRWAREAGRQIPSRKYQPLHKRTKKADAPEMPNAGKKPAVHPDLSTLKIENAVLKERIAQLEEKIRELQNSLNNLIS